MMPEPDAATRPANGRCSDCGASVEPIWLPLPAGKTRWQLADVCGACGDKRSRERERVRRDTQARQVLRDRIERAGLASPRRAGRTFATFEGLPGTGMALDRATDFAQRMATSPSEVHRGMLFVGVNGSGKTHLATAILHEVMASDVARSGLFVEFADYLGALKQSFRRSAGDETEDPEWVRYSMFEVELLVLDDIGAAAASRGGWDGEEMCRLLNHRIERGRPLIATTDVGADELAQRLGHRVVSRLYEACEVVRIEAADYRRREP